MIDAAIRHAFETVRTIAVYGASPKPERASNGVMRFLIAQGIDCVAINPGQAGGTILDRPCYARLSDVPHPIDMVDVFRRSDAVPGVVDEVLTMDPLPRVLWLQLGVMHPAAEARARDAGLSVIADRCSAIEWSKLMAA